MKITKKQLKRIIKEEMDKVIHESFVPDDWQRSLMNDMAREHSALATRIEKDINNNPDLKNIVDTYPKHTKELLDRAESAAVQYWLRPNSSEIDFRSAILSGFSEALQDVDSDMSNALEVASQQASEDKHK
jgi:hypothetical protein